MEARSGLLLVPDLAEIDRIGHAVDIESAMPETAVI
jgi:hypothetical protein